MPFPLDRFKNEAPRVIKGLVKKAIVIEVATGIAIYMREYLKGMTRADVQKGQALSIVMMLIASIPAKYREATFLAIEEILENGPLRHSPLSDILVALVESGDDSVRDFMARENITQQQALEFVRDEIVPNLSTNISNLRTSLAAKIAAKGTPVATKSKHTHPNPDDHADPHAAPAAAEAKKAGFKAEHMLKFTKLQLAMFMAVMGKAMKEARADSPDYTKFLGMARQVIEGAKILIAADVAAFIKLLPAHADGTIDRPLINEVAADPFENEEALELIHLCVFTYMAESKEWIPPHLADLADAVLDFNAFKAWVQEKKEEVATGAAAGGAAVARVRQPPKWVKDWQPAATQFLTSIKDGNKGLAKAAAKLSIAGSCSLVGGTVALAAASFLESDSMIGWGLSWSLLAVGVPLLFGARIIVSLFDTQLTFLARAGQAAPIAFKDVLKTFKIELPSERDQSVSRWSIVNVGRDNATMVTILASAGEIVVSVIAAAGMAMAMATAGFGAAAVLATLAVLANVLKDFAFIMGESVVRERLRMLEPAGSSQERKLRAKREKRSWNLALAGGTGAAVAFAAMLVVAFTGTAVVVSNKAEAKEQATQQETCREVIIRRVAASKSYAASPASKGRGLGAYCVDFPEECSRCR